MGAANICLGGVMVIMAIASVPMLNMFELEKPKPSLGELTVIIGTITGFTAMAAGVTMASVALTKILISEL